MGKIVGVEPGIPYEQKIEAEAGNLSRAMYENFKHCISLCEGLLPNKIDPQQRIIAFNSCAMAFIGGIVNTLATFGNYTPDFEAIVLTEIKARFKYIRDNESRLMNERLEEAQKNREKGKLIDVNKS